MMARLRFSADWPLRRSALDSLAVVAAVTSIRPDPFLIQRISMDPGEGNFKEPPRSFRASRIGCAENGCIPVGRSPACAARL
jgi:hypothetical protein